MTGIRAFVIVLMVMPLGHTLTVIALRLPFMAKVVLAVAIIILASLLIYLSCFLKSAAWETFTGMVAGVLLWASLVEIGVKMGAEAMGVEENRIMEFSLAIIIPLFLYLLFNPYTKCNFFIALRKILNIPSREEQPLLKGFWGGRTAFKMFTLIWIGHVVLFFTYDPEIFGTEGLLCKLLFCFCLIAGIYLFYKLLKTQKIDPAFRYAIPTVVIIWSCIETLVKWKIFSEPWITLNPLFLIIVTLIFITGLFFIIQAERKGR